MNEEESFERLCHALLEGNASEVELEQFRQLVRHSAAARKAYEQQVQIHALLTWQQGRAALPAPVVLSPADFQSPPNIITFLLGRFIPLRLTALAIAAALVMILGFAFWHLSSRNQAGAPVAPVVAQILNNNILLMKLQKLLLEVNPVIIGAQQCHIILIILFILIMNR